MNKVIRMLILVAGLACAMSAFASPITAPQCDGAPPPLHWPVA